MAPDALRPSNITGVLYVVPMPRKPNRKSSTRKISPKRSLVVVEMEPLLVLGRERCQEVASDLKQATLRIETFHTEWQPKYSSWVQTTFKESLARVEDLTAKFHEFGRIVSEVKREARIYRCPAKEAYVRLEKIKLGHRKINEACAEARARNEIPFAGGKLPTEVLELLLIRFYDAYGDLNIPMEEYMAAFEKYQADFCKKFADNTSSDSNNDEIEDKDNSEEDKGFESDFSDRAERESPAPAPGSTADDHRLKKLYRELARRLHPDVNSNVSAEEQEIWHQVTDAFTKRDLDAMEALAAMLEGHGMAGFSSIQSVATLQTIFRNLQRKLRHAESVLYRARFDPAWEFNSATEEKLEARAADMSDDFALHIEELEAKVSGFEKKIKRWRSTHKSSLER